MNKYQIKGMLMYIAGSVEERMGKFSHNSRRQVKGFQRKVSGQAIMALGDAQRALKYCITSHIPGLEENLDASNGPIRLTSKL